MKIRVLVFPCGSEIGLEIHNALMYSTHIELFGASSISSHHGKYVYKNYIEGVPFVDSHNFISELNRVIDEYRIDFIFPAHDDVVLRCMESKEILHCRVIGSPLETCQICRSKLKTYSVFKSLLEVPRVYDSFSTDISFPIFLKPDKGQGSRDTHIAYSKLEADIFLKRDQSLVPMEYIPGEEYTIDCFADRHGILRFVGPRERIRIVGGISVHTAPVEDRRLNEIAEIIHATLNFRGTWFFQMKKRKDGELVLLEVAPRIAGSMGLYRNLGVNLALLSLFDAFDKDIEIYKNTCTIEMDRALISRFRTDINYRHVYIDLDDTLIVDNKINIHIISFLYQCRNAHIKIHLLSRHVGDMQTLLRRHRIETIFDTMTNLAIDEEKRDYIKKFPAIFIDDSFSERKKVMEKFNIPVFDAHTIECLIDWRA